MKNDYVDDIIRDLFTEGIQDDDFEREFYARCKKVEARKKKEEIWIGVLGIIACIVFCIGTFYLCWIFK